MLNLIKSLYQIGQELQPSNSIQPLFGWCRRYAFRMLPPRKIHSNPQESSQFICCHIRRHSRRSFPLVLLCDLYRSEPTSPSSLSQTKCQVSFNMILAKLEYHQDISHVLVNGVRPKENLPALRSTASASPAAVLGTMIPYLCDLSQYFVDFPFLTTQSQQRSTSRTHQANAGSNAILLATAYFATSTGSDFFTSFNGFQSMPPSFQTLLVNN